MKKKSAALKERIDELTKKLESADLERKEQMSLGRTQSTCEKKVKVLETRIKEYEVHVKAQQSGVDLVLKDSEKLNDRLALKKADSARVAGELERLRNGGHTQEKRNHDNGEEEAGEEGGDEVESAEPQLSLEVQISAAQGSINNVSYK